MVVANETAPWRVREWLAAIAAFASMFVFAVSANILPAALLRAAPELGMSATGLALATSLQFVCFLVAGIAGGVLGDRVGKKHVLEAGCLLTAMGALAWAAAGNGVQAWIGAGLIGLGGGVLESQASALLADLFPRRQKLVMNLSQATFCAGAIIGTAMMASLLPGGVSWRMFFGADAGLAVALLALYWAAKTPRGEAQRTEETPTGNKVPSWSGLYVIAGAMFFYVLAETAVVVYANYHLQIYQGAPEGWAIRGISLVWGGMLVGRLLCAAMPERAPTGWLVAGLCGASAMTLVWAGSVGDWHWGIAALALTGFFFAGTWPMIVVLAAARYPKRTGTAVGVAAGAGALGAAVGPLLVTGVLNAGLGANLFQMVAAPTILCGILAAVAGRPRKDGLAPAAGNR